MFIIAFHPVKTKIISPGRRIGCLYKIVFYLLVTMGDIYFLKLSQYLTLSKKSKEVVE